MTPESAESAESLCVEERARTAISALQLQAEDPGGEGFPFVRYGRSKIELTGDVSVIFAVPGSATETSRRTQYSIGADGRMYGAVEGETLVPVEGLQMKVVLDTLEAAASKASS